MDSCKRRGFTVLEIMLVLVILGTVTYWSLNYSSRMIYIHRSNALADQTLIYSRQFANYINAYESQILQAASSSTPLIIPYADITNAGYSPAGVASTNLINQYPCASVLKNDTTNKLEAVMYYVSTSNSHLAIPQEYLTKAILSLGGLAGLYANSQVQASSWQLQNSSLFLSGTNQCNNGYSLQNNSIVVNLNLLPELNKTIISDISLHRSRDLNSIIGESVNKNTSLSNIAFVNNTGIVMNNTNKPTLMANGNNVTVQNGNLMARTIQASQQITSGTPCDPQNLSQVAQQGDATVIGTEKSNVVCSYSPLTCPNQGYCYLPVADNTVNFTGNLGATYTCPTTVPYLVTATAFQQGNPNTSVTIITSQYNGYTMPRGAIAVGNKNLLCGSWQYSYNSCWRWQTLKCQAGTNYYIPAECNHGAVSQPCNGTDYQNWTGTNPVCTNWTPPPPTYINSATCSSKLIIKVN